jgi:hypothetical protein
MAGTWLLSREVGRVGAFLLGWIERRDDMGITWDDDPDSPRSRAYDTGRYLIRR